MNHRRVEQELQNLGSDVEFMNHDGVIPSRLSRKLQRIPRLSVLEMMFDEPSSSDDYSNYMTTRSATASMRQRYPKNPVPNTSGPRARTIHSANHEPTLAPRGQQSGNRTSDAVTRNGVMENINTPTELAEHDDHEGRVRTRAQELREPSVLPSESSDDDANDVMGLIIKRIFFSLTQSNNSRFANSQPANPSRSEDPDVIIINQSPRTQTLNNNRRMEEENQAPQHSNENRQSMTQNGKRSYPKTPQMKRTYNLRSLAKKFGGIATTGTDKQALDVAVRNKIRKSLMKEKQHDNKTFKMKTRKIIKKSTNAVHIYNIVLKKCDHSKSSEAEKAKTLASKDRNFGECPVCLDKLDINILRATQCGHVFCVSCISNVYNKGDAKCPTCRGFLKPYGYHKLYL